MNAFMELPQNPTPASGKKLSVGIIGVGNVVFKSHLPTLLAMNDISVAWVTDSDHGRAEQAARSFRIKWLRMPEKLETLPHTDIVLLAAPYGVRNAYYEVLQHRNSALYVEKPIARTADEHRHLCSLFPQMAIGLQRRSWGPVVLLRKLVNESVFGKLTRIEFRHGGSAIVTAGGSFATDIKLAGGGVLFEHAIHGLDLALYIARAKSAQLCKVNTIIEKGFDVHAEGQATLTNSSGELDLDFKVSWLSETGEGLKFVFDNAVIDMSIAQLRVLLKSKERRLIMSLGDENSMYPSTGFQTLWEFWRSFIDAVRTKTVNHTSARDSLLSTELIEKIYAKGVEQ